MTLLDKEASSFRRDVDLVLRRMRPAFAEVIAALPGGVRKAADLRRALDLDAKLSWQIFKVANTPDPVVASAHVPGRASMRRFLDASASRNVSASLRKNALQAFGDFEDVVKRHANDRGSFDSMIRAIASDDSEAIDLQTRRVAYRANSRIWGVQARAKLACHIVTPCFKEDATDTVSIRGHVGLRRFRRDASLVIASLKVWDNNDTACRPTDRQPLDADGHDEHGVALLKQFCSRPLPKTHSTVMQSGFVQTEVVGRGIGNSSAVDLFLGDVSRRMGPRYRDEKNRWFVSRAMIQQPVEVLIHDLLIHEDWVEATAPELLVYADHRTDTAGMDDRECDLLPMRPSVMYLGRGASVLHTPDVPNYPAMARYAFEQLGWEGERFRAYRCRVEYPVMPSSVVLRFALPEAPSGAETDSGGNGEGE